MKFLFLLLFVPVACFSQVMDSALYQLINIPNDTERVNQLYQTGFNLRNSDPELSYQFAKVCEQQAYKSKSQKHIAKSYNLLGILFYKKGDLTKALEFQNKSLEYNQLAKNDLGIAINQTNLGNIYSTNNNFELAESAYLKALQTYNKLNNTLQIARCLINIGVLKYEHQQLDAAIHQFKTALLYASQLNDYDLMASCDNNIGTIFREQNKLDSSLVYLEEAIKLRNLTGNEIEIADCYNNLANVFIQQKNFNLASDYINLTDSICTKYDYTDAKVELYDTRSSFYEAQQNFEQALFWTKKHYELKDSLQRIEKKEANFNFSENWESSMVFDHSNGLHNKWLLTAVLLLVITIPLFLIRNSK